MSQYGDHDVSPTTAGYASQVPVAGTAAPAEQKPRRRWVVPTSMLVGGLLVGGTGGGAAGYAFGGAPQFGTPPGAPSGDSAGPGSGQPPIMPDETSGPPSPSEDTGTSGESSTS